MLKKKWLKPELIILSKNKPEEMMLTYCKSGDPMTGFNHNPGPTTLAAQCAYNGGTGGSCMACSLTHKS